MIPPIKTPPQIAFVSPYPKQGELYGTGISGIASYTKNIVKNIDQSTLVLADKINEKDDVYHEQLSIVDRCFSRNSPLLWVQILSRLLHYPSVRTVYMQFDFALYGGIFASVGIPVLLISMRLIGKQVVFVPHSVVTDVRELRGHLGIGFGILPEIKSSLMNAVFHAFYAVVGVISNQIIVLENTLKDKLSSSVSETKIVVIPHGVDTSLPRHTKEAARKQLGLNQDDYIVLFFGYVNWFKGADIFADTFAHTNQIHGKRVHAILAGGESTTMKSHGYYQEYLSDITKTVCDSPILTMTGYVPQADIATYFSACDIVIFPYRTCFAASGVLSLMFTYEKPFLISKPLTELLQSKDISESLVQAGLTRSDISFSLTRRSCKNAVSKVLRNGLKKKMVIMTKNVKSLRDYRKTARLYTLVDRSIPDVVIRPVYV